MPLLRRLPWPLRPLTCLDLVPVCLVRPCLVPTEPSVLGLAESGLLQCIAPESIARTPAIDLKSDFRRPPSSALLQAIGLAFNPWKIPTPSETEAKIYLQSGWGGRSTLRSLT